MTGLMHAGIQPLIVYPESDGQPMAENTKQFDWITLIKLGLEAVFLNDPNVFVAGDLLWYPVEGDNKTRVAPDTMVAFGRPKGPRGSYLQWLEEDIPPQVVFEVLSPGNRPNEMYRKLNFYQRYGVDEYYMYDPDDGTLNGYCRKGTELSAIESMQGWVSPRLGVRFELKDGELELYQPDGQRILSYPQIYSERTEAIQRADEAVRRADEEAARAQQETSRADAESVRAARLAAKLKELGLDPESIT